MKSRRLTLNIISIIASLVASLVFFIPTWHLDNTTVVNESETVTYSHSTKIYDYESLNEIARIYSNYNIDLNLTLANIYLALVIFTFLLTFSFTILNIITMIKKYYLYNKLTKTTTSLSYITGICAILTFVISLIFSLTSKEEVMHSQDLTYTLSINISSGVYLFTILEICASVCANIANKYRE